MKKMPLGGRMNIFRRAIAHVRLATRLLREPQVPMIFKALLIGAAKSWQATSDIATDPTAVSHAERRVCRPTGIECGMYFPSCFRQPGRLGDTHFCARLGPSALRPRLSPGVPLS